MTRIALAALLTMSCLGACSSQPKEARYSVTPKVQVTVKGGKKKPAQANYRASPDDSTPSSSGAAAK